MSKQYYREEIEHLIIDDYLKGKSASEIANKYGFKTTKSIYDKLEKNNIPRRDQRNSAIEIEKEVMELLIEGISERKIVEIIGCSRSTIQNIKKRNNWKKDQTKQTIKNLNEQEELALINDYLNGIKTKDILNKFGFKTRNSIYNIMEKHGIERRESRETMMIGKEYDNFSMEIIDNEFKAYFLGLLLSDGWVQNNQICLSMTDKDVIEFCSNFIGKDFKEIKKQGNRKLQYRITLNNPRIIEELKRYNIVEKKSYVLDAFELSKEEKKFFPYIIRGILDGDGWVRKDGKEFYICTASKNFAQWIKDELEEKLFMENVNLTYGINNIYYVRTSLEKNVNILKAIVYDKPFGMGRKYNKLHGKSSTTTMEQLA